MKKFPVDPQNINASLILALEYIRERLKNYRLNKKQESHAVLMAEESLILLIKHADFSSNASFFVNVSRLFGNIKIKLTIPGRQFNFADMLSGDLEFDDEGMPETQEAIQNILDTFIRGQIEICTQTKLQQNNNHGCEVSYVAGVYDSCGIIRGCNSRSADEKFCVC